MSIPVLVEDKKEKLIYINPLKRFVKPRWYLPNFQPSATPWIIPLAALGNSGDVPIEFDEGNGHAELWSAMAISDGPFEITILDQGRRYGWSNRAIQSGTLFGVVQRPFIFPETYFLNVEVGTRQLTVNLTDLSGAPNNVRLAFHGRAFLHKDTTDEIKEAMEAKFGDKEKTLLYFLMPQQPILAAAPGVPVNGEFVCPSDWPIEIRKLTAQSIPGGVPFDFTLVDGSNGRSYTNDNRLVLHSDMIFGNAQFPGIPYESLLLPRNWRLRFTLTNLGIAPANFYLTLSGVKVMIPKQSSPAVPVAV